MSDSSGQDPTTFERDGKVYLLSETGGLYQMTPVGRNRFSVGKALFEALIDAFRRDDQAARSKTGEGMRRGGEGRGL